MKNTLLVLICLLGQLSWAQKPAKPTSAEIYHALQKLHVLGSVLYVAAHPDETLQLWNRDAVLADVVWAIRKVRPDIIINRFDHRTAGRTHGHHTSSAVLSHEAFELTNDATKYPEQLKDVKPWQPKRLFFNTSWWFYGSREKFAEADKSNMLEVDVGVYYPVLGKSNNEIASLSRSMHKSQGFGSTGTRGSEIEYIELIKGDSFDTTPFDGINTTWGRIEGGSEIGEMIAQVISDFDIEKPELSVGALLKVYQEMQGIPNDGFWVPKKLEEIKEIIYWCTGTYVEAVADDFSAAPGSSIPVYLEAVSRARDHVKVENIRFSEGMLDTNLVIELSKNQRFNKELTLSFPTSTPYTTPYWLKSEGSLGMYAVEDQLLRGTPENTAPTELWFDLVIDNHRLTYHTPLIYKRNDPVDGEVYRPFVVTPPLYLNITQDVFVFGGRTPKTVQVLVKANQDSLQGRIAIDAPGDWHVSPTEMDISLPTKGQELLTQFQLVPPDYASEEQLTVSFVPRDTPDKSYNYGATVIEYDHIPTQTILRKAQAKVVKVDLEIAGEKVGYLMGAGDKIPEYLEQVGYDVTLLDDADFVNGNLSQYDAIVTGIRSYNTLDRMGFYQEALLDYVHRGGTLIVQYNTSRRLKTENLGPYPLKLSRERVTVEDAEVRILAPDHALMQSPNKITAADFEGWVQERGLYFANEWDDKYTPILSSNDPGEPPRDGGLLVAPYGEGWYIYTGYSWFRELPAGVPGAFRIFTNMISLGKRTEP